MSLLIKIANIIKEEAEKELYGPTSIKNQLTHLEQQLNEGKITEEEFEEKESELLDLLGRFMED
jgi:DNA-binding NarL/FixJ family response regulator